MSATRSIEAASWRAPMVGLSTIQLRTVVGSSSRSPAALTRSRQSERTGWPRSSPRLWARSNATRPRARALPRIARDRRACPPCRQTGREGVDGHAIERLPAAVKRRVQHGGIPCGEGRSGKRVRRSARFNRRPPTGGCARPPYHPDPQHPPRSLLREQSRKLRGHDFSERLSQNDGSRGAVRAGVSAESGRARVRVKRRRTPNGDKKTLVYSL